VIRVLFNHIVPFILGCLLGVSAFYLVAPIHVPAPQNEVLYNFGTGSASCRGSGTGHSGWGWETVESKGKTSAFSIISKPKATYTDAARQHNTEGSVLLKVTLLASGNVGGIRVIRGLPNGLTEQAIEAARQIKFEPKTVNGRPVSVTKTLEYTFEIY
jgi:TonB family protein